MMIEGFNELSAEEAEGALLACCGSRRWAADVAGLRPFASAQALLEAAEGVWFSLSEADWLQAFAQHPRIGERKEASTAYLSHSEAEQAAALETLEDVADGLIVANRLYEARFGFRYLVFASGRTAPELFAILRERLTHTREEELLEAARQQHRITVLRMAKYLGQPTIEGGER